MEDIALLTQRLIQRRLLVFSNIVDMYSNIVAKLGTDLFE
jgi:hypothetical protein